MRRCGTVILAAGDFPRKDGAAWRLLAAARRVVACDGAAQTFWRRFRRWPDVIVGDMDSFRPDVARAAGVEIVQVAEQETNDLDKAIALCRAHGWNDLVIVGATGRREDHTIGNVFRALAAGVAIVTDHGTFHPVNGRVTLRVRKGCGVSVFAPDPATTLASQGLRWPLAGVRPTSIQSLTLNRADATRLVVSSDRPAFVFVER